MTAGVESTLRILHIGKYWPPFMGGIETFMADLLRAQARLGIEVAALVHDHSGGALPAQESRDGVTVWRVPSYGRLLYAPLSPAFPLWLERVVRRFRPTVIHLHLPNTSVFWALASPAARRVPWVVHWHSDVVLSGFDRRLALAYRFYRPFEQAVLRRARRIVATSPPYLDSSSALAPWRARTTVVPLGIDPARVPPVDQARREWARRQWPEDTFRLLAIGRLTYYKGHEVLLRAVSREHEASLILVGEGECRPLLEQRVEELGLTGRVKLAGRVNESEVQALLAECDLFCLPSIERTEAFGVVLMEAMAYGRPSLVSAIEGSGVGWVVEAGVDGFHAPPADVDGWVSALAEARREPERLGRFGAMAARRFRERFDIDQVAAALSSLYREIG